MDGLFILMTLLSMLVGALGIIFWIWTLIDCVANKRLTETQRVIWVLVIFFAGIIGSLVYFFAGRAPKVYAPVHPYIYAQPVASAPPRVEQVPAESYPAYQEGYRVRESEHPDTASSIQSASEEPSTPQQVQHEHIQISYPE